MIGFDTGDPDQQLRDLIIMLKDIRRGWAEKLANRARDDGQPDAGIMHGLAMCQLAIMGCEAVRDEW